MSDLLPQSFGKMKLSPGSSGRPYDIGPAKRAPPAPPPGTTRASYPPLPADAATSNRYYLFGWCLPENKWLDDFARANVKNWDCMDPCHDGFCILIDITGYKYIYPVTGLPVGEVPTDVTDASTPVDMALCLSSTRSAKHFWRRPTEAQLQHMTEIMGCPPYWFKDGQMKAKYHYYEIY